MRDDQVQRYARHILLPDVGGVGQGRLLAAEVAVELADGDMAAAVALAYLAAAGVGRLRALGAIEAPVTEADVRGGTLLTLDDIGAPRGRALARRLAELNPDVQVELGGPAAGPVVAPAAPAPDLAAARAPADALVRGSQAAATVIAGIARGTP